MLPAMTEARVRADYRQFWLLDGRAAEDIGDIGEAWTDQAEADRVAVCAGAVAIGTASTCDVDVAVQVAEAAPPDDDLADWDHVVEASLEVSAGRVLLMGATGAVAASFGLPPGWWRLRAHRSVFSDHEAARIVAWPAPASPPRVLHQSRHSDTEPVAG